MEPEQQKPKWKGLDWKVVLPGLSMLLFALLGLFVLGPLETLTKQEQGQTGAVEEPAVPPSPVPTDVIADQAPTTEEGKRALNAAKAQLQHRHPGSRLELFKVDYCEGPYAVVTFLIDDQGSAGYLHKQNDAWVLVVEGADPPEEELREHGFPEEIAKYPPPCPVKPRGD